LPLPELLALLAHEDEEVVALAAEALRGAAGLGGLGLEQWLNLLDTAHPAALDVVCELAAKHVRPDQVSLEQAVQVAVRRPVPIARLGLAWLRSTTPANEAECRLLLGLTEAEAEPVRPELVRWARGLLSASPFFQVSWLLEYLDSRHADVRAEGWAWLQEEPRARNDVEPWPRLLESPYDDVRLKLVADLEKRLKQFGPPGIERGVLTPELIQFLWASVLLNIHRGGRAKPVVVGQVVRRLEHRPEEAEALLPLLSVALRSIRGPEWRAGLAGVVQLAEQHPELRPVVERRFPELRWV
jgi:hypothetical protein